MDLRPGASAPVDLPGAEVGEPAAEAPPSATGATEDPAVPAVVAVVVTHNPGSWFDDCLAGLAAQTYPGLSVLVIDAASAEDPTPRIARALPGAYVRRLDTNPGYGPASDEALGMVQGAAFYLLCHDDVALAPDAVQIMVEEAFRANAGLVGPKVVAWDDPEVIRDVGSTADKTGVQAPYAEPGELDQAQHDAVRDVFSPASGCLLIRADLLEQLDGFDPAIGYYGETLDLSWRAHVAGARVITVPAARARHREALSERPPDGGRQRLLARHRLRTVLTCYRPFSLVRVLPQAIFFTVVEAVYALLVGRIGHAREVVGAWTWNLGHLSQIRARRRALRPLRTVPDHRVRRLQVRGSARVQSYVRGRAGRQDDRLVIATRAGRDLADSLWTGPRRTALVVTVGILLLLIVSSRHLITDDIPAVGEFAAFRNGPGLMVQEWLSGWRSSGLGSESPNPTGFGILGLLGTVTFGAMGFVRKVLILGALPIGALGAWRLARPIGSRRAAVVAFIVYLAIPVPYNALANGSWGGLFLFAAAPWVILTLAKASNLAPYSTEPKSVDVLGPAGEDHAALDAEAPRVTERPSSARYLLSRILGSGLLLALVAALVPFVLVVTMLVGLGLAVGSLVATRNEGLGRIAVAAIGSPVVAFVLHLPWSLEFLSTSGGWSAFTGARSSENGLLAVGRLLRFESGPFGAPPLGWFLLVAAALPLVIGRGWRFEWAVRAWFVALTAWGMLWASHEGWLPFGLPPAEILLAPAAAGLALAAALGMAAFEIDLPGYRFGWRQALSVAAAVSVVLGTLPIFAGVAGGRWQMPGDDLTSTLGFIDTERQTAPFRVLWVGDPEVLPLAGWRVDDRLALATTDRGLPTVESLWAGAPDGATGLLEDSVTLARQRRTARLGRILGTMGVRYVVVPLRRAPAAHADEVFPVPADLLTTFDQQLDLERVELNEAFVVYRNQAWVPTRAQVEDDQPIGEDYTDATEVDVTDAENVLPSQSGATTSRGQVDADGQVLLAQTESPRWRLTVDGESSDRQAAWGWANRFTVDRSGDAELTYRTSPVRYLVLTVQVLLWLTAFSMWRRFRRGPDPEPDT